MLSKFSNRKGMKKDVNEHFEEINTHCWVSSVLEAGPSLHQMVWLKQKIWIYSWDTKDYKLCRIMETVELACKSRYLLHARFKDQTLQWSLKFAIPFKASAWHRHSQRLTQTWSISKCLWSAFRQTAFSK